MDILDQYVGSVPSVQNALDIFGGEWSTSFPARFGLTAGTAPLCEDPRITWLSDVIGGFEGREILELGPLEAGHSYMLQQGGAREVVAIEANTRAYLKCLIVKEALGLDRCHFECGDFVQYLQANERRFDVIVASGVLYHMRQPVELIRLMGECSDTVLLWTHYFDEAKIAPRANIASHFGETSQETIAGFSHTLHKYNYESSLEWKGFCGGSAAFTNWLSRGELMAALSYFGFQDISVAFDDPDHVHGPSVAFVARK